VVVAAQLLLDGAALALGYPFGAACFPMVASGHGRIPSGVREWDGR
jgi:hypothetical protein